MTALLVGRSDRRVYGLWRVSLVIGIQLAAYFGIHLLTPQDLSWHLNASLDRLFLRVLPLALMGFFIWLKSPRELSSKES